jgi:cytochrome c oxidase subunit II
MSPRRHFLVAAVVWAVLSLIGVLAVLGTQIVPVIASHEARIENDAFVLLTAASVPVLMLVVVGLVYSAIRFRSSGELDEGPATHGHTGIQAAWLGISLVLVLGLFAYGAVGLVAIRGSQSADFQVNVSAEQWAWHFEYAGGVKAKELHIPVGRRVHLVINSIDVIHSFWVPAFGVKQDAVPGRATEIFMTADRSGTYPGMCAELCGLGHTGMTMTVVVSDQASLDSWLQQQQQQPPPPPSPSK